MDIGCARNVRQFVFPAVFALLPGIMNTAEAQAMMVAIGLQESEFKARRQGGGGPARGFWQFEKGGGVKGVALHPASRGHLLHVCDELCEPDGIDTCYVAIEHNDVLAATFARLLLWTDPRLLPSPDQVALGWSIYNSNWRPGKPHPDLWPKNFNAAWALIQEGA